LAPEAAVVHHDEGGGGGVHGDAENNSELGSTRSASLGNA